MDEWHYNRLRALSGDDPSEDELKRMAASRPPRHDGLAKTDKYLIEQGWLEKVSRETRTWEGTKTATFHRVTEAGKTRMSEAEAAWEAFRHEDGSLFYAVELAGGPGGMLTVRAIAPEVAERACKQKFGDVDATVAHEGTDTDNAFLDAMNPDGMPYFRSFTGRPLGDHGMEFRVGCGLPPVGD